MSDTLEPWEHPHTKLYHVAEQLSHTGKADLAFIVRAQADHLKAICKDERTTKALAILDRIERGVISKEMLTSTSDGWHYSSVFEAMIKQLIKEVEVQINTRTDQMTDKIPDEIWVRQTENVNGVHHGTWDSIDRNPHKYHHDRIHQAVLDENKRLRDALQTIADGKLYAWSLTKAEETARKALKGQNNE